MAQSDKLVSVFVKAVPVQDVCVRICYSHRCQTIQGTGTQTYKHDTPHRVSNANANVLDWDGLNTLDNKNITTGNLGN